MLIFFFSVVTQFYATHRFSELSNAVSVNTEQAQSHAISDQNN